MSNQATTLAQPATVAVNKLLIVRSANGPQFTVIDSGLSNRCV